MEWSFDFAGKDVPQGRGHAEVGAPVKFNSDSSIAPSFQHSYKRPFVFRLASLSITLKAT
jgi:hypothetical protein